MRNKVEGGSPIGLLERSTEHTEGAVFVAIAYRVYSHPPPCIHSESNETPQLGAFGWLSGSSSIYASPK